MVEGKDFGGGNTGKPRSAKGDDYAAIQKV